jgi:hypothetical protein
MATIINASNSSGLVQTADTSGILQLQTNGVTALQVDASQNVTFTNTPSASSMTLLGTITPTVANSISLSSLTLTSYKSLYIVINNVAVTSSKQIYISSSNIQTGGGWGTNSSTVPVSGIVLVDLGTGAVGGSTADATYNSTTAIAAGGLSNVSTSTTTIYMRVSSTNSYVAGGSIVIYGVK